MYQNFIWLWIYFAYPYLCREKYYASVQDLLSATIERKQNKEPCNEDPVEQENADCQLVDNLSKNLSVPVGSTSLNHFNNRRTSQSNEDTESNQCSDSVTSFLPSLAPAQNCVYVASIKPTHQRWNMLSGLALPAICGNVQSSFSWAEDPPGSDCRQSRRKVQNQRTLMKKSPDSAGRGSRNVLLSHHLYKMLYLLILMLVFPAASCDHGCASSGWSHCDPHWHHHIPAVASATMKLQCSDTSGDYVHGFLELASDQPNGICSSDVVHVSLAELCHSPTHRVEDNHWPSSSLVACCFPVQQLAGSHWPVIQSVLWHAPVKWNDEHFNQSGICCSLYHLETCNLPPDTSFLLGSEMRPDISPAQSFTEETPPTSFYLVLMIPPCTVSQAPEMRRFCRQQGNSSRLEFLVHCYWYHSLASTCLPCAAHQTERHRQGMNRPSRMESGEACPLVSLELPVVIHSLALLFVWLMIDKRYPLIDAEWDEEPTSRPIEESNPYHLNTSCVYTRTRSSDHACLNRRHRGLQPCPQGDRLGAADKPGEMDDDTAFSSSFTPPCSEEPVDAPTPIPVATMPSRIKTRAAEMQKENELGEIAVSHKASVCVSTVTGKDRFTVELPTGGSNWRQERRSQLWDSEVDHHHSQDTNDFSLSSNCTQAVKVTCDAHISNASVCKIKVGQESGVAPLHGIHSSRVTGLSTTPRQTTPTQNMYTSQVCIPGLAQCIPNPPPYAYGVCVPPSTLNSGGTEVGVCSVDKYGLVMLGCSVDPAFTDDIELQPSHLEPAFISAPDSPDDAVVEVSMSQTLTVQHFQGQYGEL